MNRTVMSPVSAILAVADWIQTHGRKPTRLECTKQSGLPHYQTLQYVCSGGATRALALAEAYLQHGEAALSGMRSARLNGQLSACPCNVRLVSCLRCDRQITWQGAHVRLCTACRRHPPPDQTPYRLGKGARLEGRDPWAPLDDVENLIDWSTL